jgi:hypothetical protein
MALALPPGIRTGITSSSTTEGEVEMLNEGEKIRENRLRRMAKRHGLELRGSTRRDSRALDHGTYALVEPDTNAIVAGFTLDHVEEYLIKATRPDAAPRDRSKPNPRL